MRVNGVESHHVLADRAARGSVRQRRPVIENIHRISHTRERGHALTSRADPDSALEDKCVTTSRSAVKVDQRIPPPISINSKLSFRCSTQPRSPPKLPSRGSRRTSQPYAKTCVMDMP